MAHAGAVRWCGSLAAGGWGAGRCRRCKCKADVVRYEVASKGAPLVQTLAEASWRAARTRAVVRTTVFVRGGLQNVDKVLMKRSTCACLF